MANPLGPTPIKIPQLKTGKPEITMAPLIDVIFLLLIFFMVTTVFPENRGLIIEKPQSKHSELLKLKKLTFYIRKNGEISFSNRKINVADVKRLVREQLDASPDSAVMLQVDKHVTTERLIKVMDACKSGGAERVGIATKPDDS